MKHSVLIVAVALICASCQTQIPAADPAPWKIASRENVASVWSGNPVGFAFVQKEGQLFIGFYSGEDKSMVIGQKRLPDGSWKFKKLDTKIGWDSHNYVTIAFDRDNCLHVCGNMHCVPLIYYRSSKPLDIDSLEPINRMTAAGTTMDELRQARENKVTYPTFMSSADGALIFTYRDGASGNGIQLWNVYDPESKTWKRFLDAPMFDGLGLCNAYFNGPVKGPDGWYHIAWVWRDTPDCETNHDLSYMRSRDLIHWETSQGASLTLPVTEQTGEVVAPLKNGEGLLNSLARLGFDTQNRVVITYTRYDENKNNQIMQARLENGVWKHYQTTDWTHSWVFSGRGCIPGELSFSAVRCENGKLFQSWNRKYEKSGDFELDGETLKPIGAAPSKSKIPAECYKVENTQENQGRKTAAVTDASNPNRLYFFVWETLPINRDRPHDVVPQPSQLRMFVLERE